MKTTVNNVLTLMAVLFFGVSMVACSKDDAQDEELKAGGSFNMEINGQYWEADIAGVSMFDAEEFDDEGELHGAMVTGASGEASKEGYRSIMLVLGMSESRLNSPNGTYPFVLEDDDLIDGRAATLYMVWNNGVAIYAMTEGSVTITGSELGEQTFMGMPMGRGFNYLRGTFSGTLQLAPGDDAPSDAPQTLTITNGKFNVPNTSGFADFPGF